MATNKSYYVNEETELKLKRLRNYLSTLTGNEVSESKALGFLIAFVDTNIGNISSADLKTEFNNYLASSKKSSNIDSIVDSMFSVK
jgi:hypothetical protein